jgi:hypothetical protein
VPRGFPMACRPASESRAQRATWRVSDSLTVRCEQRLQPARSFSLHLEDRSTGDPEARDGDPPSGPLSNGSAGSHRRRPGSKQGSAVESG